jgi:hypothetical protein
MSLVTTLPAPMTAFEPIRTRRGHGPGRTEEEAVAGDPIKRGVTSK